MANPRGRPRTKPLPPARDKRAKFVTFAQRRTSNAMRTIRQIGKLGNRQAYDYTDTDVDKITTALEAELEMLRQRMTGRQKKAEIDFTL